MKNNFKKDVLNLIKTAEMIQQKHAVTEYVSKPLARAIELLKQAIINEEVEEIMGDEWK